MNIEFYDTIYLHRLPKCASFYIRDCLIKNNKNIYDYIIKYETLDLDLKNIFPSHVPSSPKNVSHTKNVNINDLTRESIDKINILYEKDFEIFGYEMM